MDPSNIQMRPHWHFSSSPEVTQYGQDSRHLSRAAAVNSTATIDIAHLSPHSVRFFANLPRACPLITNTNVRLIHIDRAKLTQHLNKGERWTLPHAKADLVKHQLNLFLLSIWPHEP